MIMVSAQNLLTVYLGLELLALSQYAMVALLRDDGAASEAAMKYFVLGALASGMLLYGMSMVYGASGSLDLGVIREVLALGSLGATPEAVGNAVALDPAFGDRTIGARFGLVFIIVGIAFKLGAVPFHMWVPDVYEGAPTSVTMFISTAPKLAAFAMLIRLLVDGLEVLNADWQQMLAILAVLSVVVGNLVAIAQTNVKRMLAYSTISHVGFLLMGVVGAEPAGYSAAMFYAITYAFTTLAAFGVLLALSRGGHEAVTLDDLAGLARRNSLLAIVMLLAMISLAGVPPTVGFYAKLVVLQAAIGGGLHLARDRGRHHVRHRRVLLPPHREARLLRRAGRGRGGHRDRGGRHRRPRRERARRRRARDLPGADHGGVHRRVRRRLTVPARRVRTFGGPSRSATRAP